MHVQMRTWQRGEGIVQGRAFVASTLQRQRRRRSAADCCHRVDQGGTATHNRAGGHEKDFDSVPAKIVMNH